MRRFVDREHVGRHVGQNVQRGLQAVARLRLQDRVRQVTQVVDVVGERVAVFGQELLGGGQQAVGISNRAGGRLIRADEIVGQLVEVFVQRDELLVVLVQRVDEHRQALQHGEEVAAALVQCGQRSGQAVQCGVDLLTLTGQPVGEGLDDVAERPFGLVLGRSEFVDDVSHAVTQLIPLHRHLGALDGDHRAVGHHRPAFVRLAPAECCVTRPVSG